MNAVRVVRSAAKSNTARLAARWSGLDERGIGTMLPCNVIVQQKDDGSVEVSAVDPVASMLAIENSALGEIAKSVRKMLKTVIEDLAATKPV